MSLRAPRGTKIWSADVPVGIAMRITALQTEFVGWWLCPTKVSGHSIMVGRSRHPLQDTPKDENVRSARFSASRVESPTYWGCASARTSSGLQTAVIELGSRSRRSETCQLAGLSPAATKMPACKVVSLNSSTRRSSLSHTPSRSRPSQTNESAALRKGYPSMPANSAPFSGSFPTYSISVPGIRSPCRTE